MTGWRVAAAPVAAPRYEPLDTCFAQPPEDLNLDLDMDCGFVTVPESRSGKSDREVKLGFTRFSSGKGADSSPLFMLAGGPGQTQVSPQFFSMFQPELLGGILAERDVVLVEQRARKALGGEDQPRRKLPLGLSAGRIAGLHVARLVG